MKALGNKLKLLRENAGLSVDQLHAKTKISLNTINYLESGNTAKLPAKSFLRGFVASYARAVGAPVEELLNEFDQEYQLLFPIVAQVPRESKQSEDPENRQNILWFNTSGKVSLFLSIGLILGLIYLIYFFTGKISSYNSEEQPPAVAQTESAQAPADNSSPSNLSGSEIPHNESSTPLTTMATSSNTSTLTPTKPELTADIKKEETKKEPSVVGDAKPTQGSAQVDKKNVDVKAVDVVPTEVKPAQAKAPEVKPATITAPIAHRFAFKATANVSVKVTPEGEPPKLFTILAGKERIFETTKPVVIDLSEGGILSIIHNGEDKGLPGIEGQPLRLVYP